MFFNLISLGPEVPTSPIAILILAKNRVEATISAAEFYFSPTFLTFAPHLKTLIT
jgi:hypothetical protein